MGSLMSLVYMGSPTYGVQPFTFILLHIIIIIKYTQYLKNILLIWLKKWVLGGGGWGWIIDSTIIMISIMSINNGERKERRNSCHDS